MSNKKTETEKIDENNLENKSSKIDELLELQKKLQPLLFIAGVTTASVSEEDMNRLLTQLQEELAHFEAIGILDSLNYFSRAKTLERNTRLMKTTASFLSVVREVEKNKAEYLKHFGGREKSGGQENGLFC